MSRPAPWFEDRRWLALAVALLTGLCYLDAVPAALVYDDATAIAGNPAVGGVSRIPTLFRESAREGASGERRLYRPVTMATLAVDRTLYGNDPRGYHVTNVLLHVAATLVLFVLLSALGAAPLAGALGPAEPLAGPAHPAAVRRGHRAVRPRRLARSPARRPSTPTAAWPWPRWAATRRPRRRWPRPPRGARTPPPRRTSPGST